jgi:hypothetical protein
VNPNSTRFRDVDKVPHWREQIEVRITIPTVYNKFNLIFMSKRTVIFKIETIYFSASQSGKYSVTLHFRSREVRFPVQCQKFLVECGKNLVEYGKNVRTPLIYSFHSYFKIKVSIRYFNLV